MRPITSATIAAFLFSSVPIEARAAQDSRNLPPPGWGGGGGGFAGTLRCDSNGGRERVCRVRTDGRVQLLQVERGRCREGRDWEHGANSIRVRNGCAATFGYGYAAGGRPPAWNANDFAGTLTCTAPGRREQRCYVQTDNRVQVLDDRSRNCIAGRTWGYTQSFIWTRDGCTALFGYGYGRNGSGWRPDRPDNDGPSAGAIIGGVAVAAGLVALLASSRKKKSGAGDAAALPSFPAGPPAAVNADIGLFPAAARTAGQTCLDEAARQIGLTGGTRLRLERVRDVRAAGGDWSFRADAESSYPDGSHATPFTCRANAERVRELTFTG